MQKIEMGLSCAYTYDKTTKEIQASMVHKIGGDTARDSQKA